MNDGVLEGVSVGKTEVKVYVSGNQNVSATVTVKVTAKDNKPVATFNEVPDTLYVGEQLQLKYELANPENECEVVFQSLTAAATIDKNGLINVLEEGYGLILVKVTDKVTGQYVSYNFAFKTVEKFNITYKNLNDVNNDENPSFYVNEQKDIELKNLEKRGWTFLGWFEDEKLSKPISFIDVDRKEDITLYAGWEAITYEIEYIVNGGSLPIDAKFEYQYSVSYELPIPAKLPIDKGPLEGYKFAGWYDNEKFEGQSITAISTTDEGNKTYYAKWVDTILIEVEEPVEGVAYKLGMYQKGLQKWLWMTGVLEGYYGSAVEKHYNAADVEVVKVNDGYNLKVVKTDGSVVYINAEVNGSYNNIKFDNAPASIWNFNEEYNTFTTTTSNGVLYMGTYSNTTEGKEYDTFSLSYISFFGNSTSYISHLYQEVEDNVEVRAELALKDLKLENELDTDYALPEVSNVVWELLDGKDVAKLENGKLVITRPEVGEDDVEVVVTAKYEVEGNVVKTKEFKVLVLAEEPLPQISVLMAKFKLGKNGSAVHNDGTNNETATYLETSNGNIFSFTDGVKVYKDTHDAKGNSCLKLGTSKLVGSFSFDVPTEVTKVIIYVAKYKSNDSVVSVNGTNYSLTKNSNDGEYDAIEIDTSVEKTILFATVSGGIRCMINTIEYYGYGNELIISEKEIAEEALEFIEVTTELSEDYDLPVYENIVWSLAEEYNAAKIENGVIVVERQNEEKTIVLVATYGETEYKKEFSIKIVAKQQGGSVEESKPVTVSITASNLGLTNGKAFSSKKLDDVITISASKGSGSTNPAYYNDGTALRIYGGNTFTVSVQEGYKIQLITITTPTGKYGISTSNCSLTNATATGMGTVSIVLNPVDGIKSVVLTNPNSKDNFRIVSISVSYIKDVGSSEGGNQNLSDETLSIIAAKGSLSNNVISWTSANFIFENHKYNSTNAIRVDDSDHFRCYKDSKTVITALNGAKISKIVITTTGDSKYKTALKDSIDTSLYNVSVSGNNYTIVPKNGKVDSIVIIATAGQWRLNNIVVSF